MKLINWTALSFIFVGPVDGFSVLDRRNAPCAFSASALHSQAESDIASRDIFSSQQSYTPTFDTIQDDDGMRTIYLQRIGITDDHANEFMSTNRSLDIYDLQHLYTAHLLTVPFENLDQHTHPAHDETNEIPRLPNEELPSLDVRKTLKKICINNRGGFCFELNTSFAWLLRSLGFNIRLALADVGCSQAIPGHVVILVDGLLPQEDGISASVLVDVGFGTPGVCDVILPLIHDKPKFDMHGDSFRFSPCDEMDRYDTVLYRKRINKEDGAEEPMYRFHSEDNLPDLAGEFQKGLQYVLNDSPTFNEKRLCVISTEDGHCTLGEQYVKWVEKGQMTQKIEFHTETAWREALLEHFGVVL